VNSPLLTLAVGACLLIFGLPSRFTSVKSMAQTPLTADLILLNGKIWTGSDARPEAEAVACRGSRVVAVGTNDEVRRLAGPRTRMVDLQGQRVVPGFNDAHVHFYNGGAGLASVQLRDAKSEAEFRKRIQDFAAKSPKGRWILEGNWDHESWSPARLPTRQLIDGVTPDHPVFVQRLDGHMALANSLALRLAGVTRETPNPPGGEIVRDARGEPTGVLKDAAMAAVYRVIPQPDAAQIEEALRAAMRYAAENGVTSVQDMSASPEVFAAYQRLLERGELTVRVSGHQPLSEWKRLAGVGVRAGFGNEKLKIGALKGFADGSLGSTTALFFEPYTDAPHTRGLPSDEMIPESRMLENIVGADAAGLQVAVHAIGDQANQTVLKMFAEAERRNGARDRRFRVEHAQHLRAEEIKSFARQKVVASMQPYHAIDDGRWADKRIGPERAKGTYAFRSLLDAGATLAFGSDWFVAPMEPLMGIYAAVTRRTLDGKNPQGWVPEQKITVAEAVRAYTLGSSYASFDEKLKGSIEVGKLADLAVLSDDIFSINPAEIERARVVMTVFDGRVIFERGK
jgi:predicted amidohydrolase YtcJ